MGPQPPLPPPPIHPLILTRTHTHNTNTLAHTYTAHAPPHRNTHTGMAPPPHPTHMRGPPTTTHTLVIACPPHLGKRTPTVGEVQLQPLVQQIRPGHLHGARTPACRLAAAQQHDLDGLTWRLVEYGRWSVVGGIWMAVGRIWLVVGGWLWLVVGGIWLVVGRIWLVVGGWLWWQGHRSTVEVCQFSPCLGRSGL